MPCQVDQAVRRLPRGHCCGGCHSGERQEEAKHSLDRRDYDAAYCAVVQFLQEGEELTHAD